MTIQLSNNASAQLAGSLNAADTTLIVQAGSGGMFPALPAGDWFPATIVAADGTVEIVRVTARNADTFTVVRGQEDTAPSAFPIGSRVELRMTAGAFVEMIADKLERSGGSLTGPVTSSSFFEADGGFKVGDRNVWHEGTFDPATKLNRSGNQRLEANTFEVAGENARLVLTYGEHSLVLGIGEDGRLIIGFGTGYDNQAIAIQTDKRIWTAQLGYLDNYIRNVATEVATEKANSVQSTVLDAIRSGYIQGVRLGASLSDAAGTQISGHVMTAWGYLIANAPTGIFRPLQVKVDGQWFTVETV